MVGSGPAPEAVERSTSSARACRSRTTTCAPVVHLRHKNAQEHGWNRFFLPAYSDSLVSNVLDSIYLSIHG